MKSRVLKQLVVVTALSAFAAGSALAAVMGKVGHAMPESHPQAQAMNKFVELAAKYTNNNVQLKAFHGAVLGSDEKQLPAFLLPALLSAEKDAKIKQLKNHTGRGAHKNARWTIK